MQHKISKSIILFSVLIFSVAAVCLNLLVVSMFVLLSALLYFYRSGDISSRFSYVLILAFVLGTAYTILRMPKGDILQHFASARAEISGVVDSSPVRKGQKTKFVLKVSEVVSEKGSKSGALGKVMVSIYKAGNIQIGDRLRLSGKLYEPFYAKNLGQFDYREYLKNKGIFTTFYTNKYEVVGVDESFYYQLIRRFNKFRKKIMLAHQGAISDASKLLGGVIFGYRAVDVSPSTMQDFKNAGLLHLLSASGLHVGLILGIWYFFTKVFRFPYAVSIVSGGLVVLLYSCLTGFPPSIIRAMLMAEFILLGKLVDRKADSIVLLLMVCVMMLIFDPMYIKNVGFQLSFVVTFGILYSLPILIERFKQIPETISGMFFLPAIAQLWALPLLVYHFNSMPLYSVLANIVVIPFMAVVSFVGFLSSICALIPFVDGLSFFMDKFLEPFLWLFDSISKFFSHLPYSVLYIAKPKLIVMLSFYIGLILASILIKKNFLNRKISTALGALLLVLMLFGFNYDFSKKMQFTFFSVGNADAILVNLPNKKSFLIDAGRIGFRGYNSGKTIINEYLKDIGASVDALVLTHPDSDHIGGALDVLRYTKLKQLYMIDKHPETKVYKHLQTYISQSNLSPVYVKTNDKIQLDDDVAVKFIVPEGTDSASYNDDSIITYIRYGDFSALLMGDNEKQVFDLLKKHIKKPITLLKVGHHGSAKSLSPQMVSRFKPSIAVISAGKNSFGHPNKRIVDILKSNDVQIFRTDIDNMIQMSIDGRGITGQKFVPVDGIMKNVPLKQNLYRK